jgi:hypothetical protein
LIGSSLITATPYATAGEREMSTTDARMTVRSWPQEAKKAAEAMLQKDGQPDEITAMQLVWHDNGRWAMAD